MAFHQGLDEAWSFDVSADFLAYGNNTNAGAEIRQTASQHPTGQAQAFLNYAWASRVTTSVGYEEERGGRQYLGGVATAAATSFDEVRFINSFAVTPAFQILGEINHQFSVVGGSGRMWASRCGPCMPSKV